jgi:membrane protease YdiL (CAAX protease family)
MKENKKIKGQRALYEPVSEPALPMLLLAVCSAIALIALVLDSFIFPFSDNLLAPVIMQIVTVALPCYLALMLLYPNEKPISVAHRLGFRKISVRYIFFIIFTVPFMACVSLFFTMLFGDIPPVSEGFSLLGIFRVGYNDFSVSAPYLILCYALIPAVFEEILLRSIVFGQTSKVSKPLGAFICAAAGALLSFELSLASLLSGFATGLILIFVLYTTESLGSCIIVHSLFNLYRIFLEGNIVKYHAASYNNILFAVVFLVALLVSCALFASECARIYRADAKKVADGEQRSRPLDLSIKDLRRDLAHTFSFRPTLVCSIIFAACFVVAAVINIIV